MVVVVRGVIVPGDRRVIVKVMFRLVVVVCDGIVRGGWRGRDIRGGHCGS
jgi:hypothetical protein